MKKPLWTLLLAFGLLSAFARPPAGWLTDFDRALEIAKKENKHVYVLFTGSDWCHWCIKLRKEVLEQPAFQKFAHDHLVPVYCDFPQKTRLPQEQLARQRKWSRDLQAGSGVPSAVIVNPDGKVTGRIGGFAKADAYLKKLKNAIR